MQKSKKYRKRSKDSSFHRLRHMRKLTMLFYILVSFQLPAQTAGQWIWQQGGSTINSFGSFGAMGVPAASNTPPSLYEACNWTDAAGNFWLFGGAQNSDAYNAMWKFDPLIKQWTWMAGPSTPNGNGVYGTMGIPSPLNVPGARGWGVLTWTDLNNHFWLMGGRGSDASGNVSSLNDLWMFNPSTLQWTWMSGSNLANASGNFGTMGVPSVNNVPPYNTENHFSWTDHSNNLWLYGGFVSSGVGDDLWKYSISTNQWTWVSGSGGSGIGSSPVYGPLGTEASSNTPGARSGYTSFTDPYGNMFLFGAILSSYSYCNDVWRYNPLTGNWAWFGGTQNQGDPGAQLSHCDTVQTNVPQAAMEIRASWADSCGFWFFGGYDGNSSFDNLWYYNAENKKFTWTSGTNILNNSGSYGTMGIAAAGNLPPARNGAVTWADLHGNLWLFGGELDFGLSQTYNDLWMYTPDPHCVHLCSKSQYPPNAPNNPVECEKFIVPNYLTPNGDKWHEFLVTAECFKTYNIDIFDRWGVKVFASSEVIDPYQPWNGKLHNTGKDCTSGTYYYIITTVNMKDVSTTTKGFLTLIRD
jgi:gliding motility-associated-like protein